MSEKARLFLQRASPTLTYPLSFFKKKFFLSVQLSGITISHTVAQPSFIFGLFFHLAKQASYPLNTNSPFSAFPGFHLPAADSEHDHAMHLTSGTRQRLFPASRLPPEIDEAGNVRPQTEKGKVTGVK